MTTTIGFIGVGDMGGPMARNLLHAGYTLVAYDLDATRVAALVADGAIAGADAADVADQADLVFACLNSVAGMRDVARAVASSCRTRVYADFSTSGPTLACELRECFAGTSIHMLDAPISGQVNRAVDGTLALMVSGDADAFALAKPAFDVVGGHVFYLGAAAGGGQLMKVANNLINNVQTLATAEAIIMGMKYGLDAEQMFAVLNVSTGRNSQTDGQLRNAVLNNDFSLGALISISQKDIKLAVDEAAALGVPVASAEASQAAIEGAIGAHGKSQRSSAIFKHLAILSGLDIDDN